MTRTRGRAGWSERIDVFDNRVERQSVSLPQREKSFDDIIVAPVDDTPKSLDEKAGSSSGGPCGS